MFALNPAWRCLKMLLCVIVVGAHMVPPANSQPSGYTFCANENETCTLPGTYEVAYGADGNFNYQIATGSIACNNATFGDPIYGTVKACYYGPSNYTFCANEGGTCTFSGTRQVAYGAGAQFNYRTATGSIDCDNATFGDPIYGTVKACFYSNSQSGGSSQNVKNLYAYFNTDTLSRVVPSANTNSGYIAGNGGTVVLTMSPSTRSALTLGSGTIRILLCMDRDNRAGGQGRDLTVALDYVATGAGGSTGTIGSQTRNRILTSNGYQLVPFTINLASDLTLNADTAIRLTVTNNSPAGNRRVRISSLNCTTPSQVQLNVDTVINVESVDIYDAVYPGGAIQPVYTPNTTVYIRAVVSDPFGSFDISSANVEIIDALGATAQASTPMTQVNDSGAATRTYEYQYTIPSATATGDWTARVTANEGTEGTIFHLGEGTFTVGKANISLLKRVSTVSDPVNAVSNPKAIPGAIVEFQITATNSGPGYADDGSVEITDPISSDFQLYLGNPADPIQFSDGSPSSGLGFAFIDLADATDDVDFSNDGGSSFVTPNVDANGFDITVPPINYIRLTPSGRFNGSTGGGDPNFTVRFRARVR